MYYNYYKSGNIHDMYDTVGG